MGLYAMAHHRGESEAEARERVGALLAKDGIDEGKLRLEHGPPALVLNGLPAHVLVVVRRRRSWLEHAVFGSVTRALLEGSAADVLVV